MYNRPGITLRAEESYAGSIGGFPPDTTQSVYGLRSNAGALERGNTHVEARGACIACIPTLEHWNEVNFEFPIR
jgi:hypothetical protein